MIGFLGVVGAVCRWIPDVESYSGERTHDCTELSLKRVENEGERWRGKLGDTCSVWHYIGVTQPYLVSSELRCSCPALSAPSSVHLPIRSFRNLYVLSARRVLPFGIFICSPFSFQSCFSRIYLSLSHVDFSDVPRITFFTFKHLQFFFLLTSTIFLIVLANKICLPVRNLQAGPAM